MSRIKMNNLVKALTDTAATDTDELLELAKKNILPEKDDVERYMLHVLGRKDRPESKSKSPTDGVKVIISEQFLSIDGKEAIIFFQGEVYRHGRWSKYIVVPGIVLEGWGVKHCDGPVYIPVKIVAKDDHETFREAIRASGFKGGISFWN